MDRNILIDDKGNELGYGTTSQNLKTINAIGIIKGYNNFNEKLRSIPDSIKKKYLKIINSHFDYAKKQFISILWAYLDLNDEKLINYNLFDLLFSNCNDKCNLFDLYIDKPKFNSIKQNEINKIDLFPASSIDDELKIDYTYINDYNNELNRLNCNNSMDIILKTNCENFFKTHGLTIKIRKLPLDYNCYNNKRLKNNSLNFPSYHFISRQRRHMFEQIMRSRTFLDTRYNSCNEMRNSKSPFSLFELHPNILNYFKELKDDIDDPEFSGMLTT